MTPKQMAQARERLGLTLEQMAEVLGYQGVQKRQMQYDLETGRREIREPQRRLIEAYLSGYRPGDWPDDTGNPGMMAAHEITADGESTAQWAIRQPGFLGSMKQLCCCARCGETLPGGKHTKRKVFNLMKPNTHFLCDDCFAELPE